MLNLKGSIKWGVLSALTLLPAPYSVSGVVVNHEAEVASEAEIDHEVDFSDSSARETGPQKTVPTAPQVQGQVVNNRAQVNVANLETDTSLLQNSARGSSSATGSEKKVLRASKEDPKVFRKALLHGMVETHEHLKALLLGVKNEISEMVSSQVGQNKSASQQNTGVAGAGAGAGGTDKFKMAKSKESGPGSAMQLFLTEDQVSARTTRKISHNPAQERAPNQDTAGSSFSDMWRTKFANNAPNAGLLTRSNSTGPVTLSQTLVFCTVTSHSILFSCCC